MSMEPGSDDGPPSYSDSIYAKGKVSDNAKDSQDGPDLVHALLTIWIIPHVRTAISSSTLSSTLIIIPSDIATLQPPVDMDAIIPSQGFPGEKVVGFPSAEELTLIRLSNPEDTHQYWQRQATKQLLADAVHAYLVQEGYYFPEDITKTEPFERMTGISSEFRKGWMTANEEQLRHREARINVSMQEICLRVEDKMGLYETKKGKALVVRLRMGRGESCD